MNALRDPVASLGQSKLSVAGLQIDVEIGGRAYPAVQNLSLVVSPGEIHGLVGESGSGKSLTLRAIIGLLPLNARITSGDIKLGDLDLTELGVAESQRGRVISMVFQEPSAALNPLMRVGRQIVDGAIQLNVISKADAKDYAIYLMEQVGIPRASERISLYPHQLSGGMKQRVVIAAAIASKSRFILCDEPTTALDVTVQAQILEVFRELRTKLDVGLLYVTHDLAVVSEICSSVSVMYAGRIVEQGTTNQILRTPRHDYTRALINSSPSMTGKVVRLKSIPGTTPSLDRRPANYDFAMRIGGAEQE